MSHYESIAAEMRERAKNLTDDLARDLLSWADRIVKSPAAYCTDCNAVGMSNCAHFTECPGSRCITCHRPLNIPEKASAT